MINPLWRTPQATPTLLEHEVHIWVADLDEATLDSPLINEVLSPGELTCANRYAHARERRRSIAARAVLRRLLGIYTGTPARAIDIRYHSNGKPCLQSHQEASPLEFNLSHSENIALYAFCWDHPVGVDIERIQNTGDIDTLACTVLAASEYSAFHAGPDMDRTRLLYRYWTCKEALIKAAGTTLDEVRHVVIPLEPQTRTGWIQVRAGTSSDLWALREIAPLLGYAAALATKRATTLRFWTMSFAPRYIVTGV